MADRSIRIFVRTKRKYEPSQFQSQLWYTDVTDFAGCTVGDIKRACHKKTDAKVDDLFYLNQSLADDRSVAHYNFPDGTILETTSNPLWVAMIQVKMVEIERERDTNPDNPGVQRWTHKSYIRKLTLLSVLFNAKKKDNVMPQNFPTYEDFVIYLERLGRKGATINPAYSGQDFQRWFAEYLELDVGHPDPIRSFQTRHAMRLGLTGPTDGENTAGGGKKKGKNTSAQKGKGKQTVKRIAATVTRPRQERLCEDCEQNFAEIYCGSCVGSGGTVGVLLCMDCTHHIHRGALRGNHDCKDISEAPRAPPNPQAYCPHPYKAPFAIVLAMTRALSENLQKLSMDEEEIKQRAQPLTDTDLHDKQAGKIMGGFDCIENTLIPKHLVQKEASGRHTFALTQAGRELGQKLDVYDQALQRFLMDSGIPCLPATLQTRVGNQRLVLVVDQRERDLPRLHSLARTAGINIIVRKLPVADYVWVLAPGLDSLSVPYDGSQPEQEIMLPVLVERKSWNDLHDTMRFDRWDAQIRRMKACGFPLNFLLIEGCINDLRQVPQERKDKLQSDLERLSAVEGFHISQTFCWSKSRAWLFWLTHLLAAAYAHGHFAGETLLFSQLQARVTQGQRQMRAGHVVRPLKLPGPCHVWEADKLVTAIFRESLGEKKMMDTCREFFQAVDVRQLILLADMETFNKNRHTMLYNCLRLASSAETCTKNSVTGVIEDQLMGNLKGLVHYDVVNFWILYMQVNHQVYVVRTESEEDTKRLTDWFSQGRQEGPAATGGGEQPVGNVTSHPSPTQHRRKKARISPAKTKVSPSAAVTAQPVPSASYVDEAETNVEKDIEKTLDGDDFATDSQVEERMLQEALSLSLISSLDHDEDPYPQIPASPPSPRQSRHARSSASGCPGIGENSFPAASQSTHSLDFVDTSTSQSLDIIPPTVGVGEDDSLRSLALPALSSAPVQKLLNAGRAEADASPWNKGDNNFVPPSVNSDSDEWNPALASTLACDDPESFDNSATSPANAPSGSPDVQGGAGSPLGFSLDDPIMIDSQGDDDKPVSAEMESVCEDINFRPQKTVITSVDEDEALARRLQEEENLNRAKCTGKFQSIGGEAEKVSFQPEKSQIYKSPQQDLNKNVISKTQATAGLQSQPQCPKSLPNLAESQSQESQSILAPVASAIQNNPDSFFHPSLTKKRAFNSDEFEPVDEIAPKKSHLQVETDEELAERLYKELNSDMIEKYTKNVISKTKVTAGLQSQPQCSKRLSNLAESQSQESQSVLAPVTSAIQNNPDSFFHPSLTKKRAFNSDEFEPVDEIAPKKSHLQVETDEELAERLYKELNSDMIEKSTDFSGLDRSPSGGSQLFSAEHPKEVGAVLGDDEDADEALARKLQEEELKASGICFETNRPVSNLGMARASEIETSYLDEDEELARKLQLEEETEAKGSVSQMSTSSRRAEFKDVLLQDNECVALKVEDKSEGEMKLNVTDYLKEDEELARKLQEEETKLGLGNMKLYPPVDWAAFETKPDGQKLYDEDSKAHLLSQLEDYRKSQEFKYSTQKGQGRPSAAIHTPNKNRFPSSFLTSTPKAQLKKFAAGFTPDRKKEDINSRKPVPPLSDVGDTKYGSQKSVPSKGERKTSIGGEYATKSTPCSTAGKTPYHTTSHQTCPSVTKFDNSHCTPKRNVSATVTSRDTAQNFSGPVGLSGGGDFSDSFRSDEKKSSLSLVNRKSSVLPTVNVKSDHSHVNDSIDLTDDDASFTSGTSGCKSALNNSCVSNINKVSGCKSDSSVLFPAASLKDRAWECGTKERLEKGTANFKTEHALGDLKPQNITGQNLDDDVTIIDKTDPCQDIKYNDLENRSSSDAGSTPVASNVKCGSCGQKGHNRRFERCPNYYTEKEKKRRDAVDEAQRRRLEERAREAEERQREEQRALQRLARTRETLQQNKEQMMQQIATATQACATQFQSQLDDIDKLMTSKDRKIKGYQARQRKK